jgi:hypothetical protein
LFEETAYPSRRVAFVAPGAVSVKVAAVSGSVGMITSPAHVPAAKVRVTSKVRVWAAMLEITVGVPLRVLTSLFAYVTLPATRTVQVDSLGTPHVPSA